MKQMRVGQSGWMAVFALVFFISACFSSSNNLPLSTPVSEASIKGTLNAVVVSTAAAAQTKTKLAEPPTLTPTLTRAPSKTPTPITPSPTTYLFSYPTSTIDIFVEGTNSSLTTTPTLSVSAYMTSSAGGSNGKSSKSSFYHPKLKELLAGGVFPVDRRTEENQWLCYVRYSPHFVTAPNKKFTAYWTILNAGWNPWTSNAVDFVYKGGLRHQGRVNIQDISSTVSFSKTLTIGATFIAPNKVGKYSAYYMIKVDATRRTEFCPMWLSLTVE